jgi:endonuclease/exonuclease/phosphatase family metal-dependent hydrolase
VKRVFLLLLLLPCIAACSPGLTVLCWNVENLFDDVDDGTEFPEYDPGRGRWDTESFRLRVDTVAETIRKAVPGGPDVLVLQEVENENALRALVGEALKDLDYAWTAIVAKPDLPANIAVASRAPIARVHTIGVSAYGDNELRDLLEVEIEQDGRRLHVFNNHWKAKSGGTRQTEGWRVEAACKLGRRVREILDADPQADILAAGDFNENVDEWLQAGRAYQAALVPIDDRPPAEYLDCSILLTGRPAEAGMHNGALVLYEPWYEIAESERGSYSYQHQWQTVDHVLLSPGLFDNRGYRYRRESFRVVRLPFLLAADGTPKRWSGLSGVRGYSDHLPLLVTLDLVP